MRDEEERVLGSGFWVLGKNLSFTQHLAPNT
jgi:hypothetical protein